MPSTRWWESYAVRYFIGFVVGGICVAVLAHDLDLIEKVTQLLTGNKDKADWSPIFFVLAFLGFGYCYAASTPIAVLHFGRYKHGFVDGHARHFWFGWLIVILLAAILGTRQLGLFPSLEILGVIIGAGLSFFVFPSRLEPPLASKSATCKKEKEKKKTLKCNWDIWGRARLLLIGQSLLWAIIIWCFAGRMIGTLNPSIKASVEMLWLFGAPVIWIGISQYFVLLRLFVEDADIYDYYKKLFHARRQTNAKDVRDTYAHLREHSNSVFIVVVELAILSCLLALHKTFPEIKTTDDALHGYFKWGFIGLVIWMLPTVFLWGRANAFEKKLGTDPGYFLKPRKTKT